MRPYLSALAVLALGAVPAIAAPSLPGEASSLSEVHGDWTVGCGIQGQGSAAKLSCAVSQRQSDKASQRQILLLELTPSNESAKGVLVLPLGVDLARGAVLQVDTGKATPPQAYSTCVPAGCVVPLNFDAANLKLLRAGKTLNVVASAVGGKAVKLAVPLDGLPAALDRAGTLLAAK